MDRSHGSAAGPDPIERRDPTPRLTVATSRDEEETFGQRLRRERECRQITIESIATKTKISASFFEALERDNVSRWPSGVFRRAFIRSYAQAIGLDPDAIAREFMTRYPDPAIAEAAPDARTPAAAPSGPTLRLTMEDTRSWFTGGRFLSGTTRRWAAVGCDMVTIVALGVLVFLALGVFWMPLAVAALSYYAVSVIVLGNTPGVCLFAPLPARQESMDARTVEPRAGLRPERDILRSLIAARQMAASNKGS
jgi:transcriptional regulator with XRE-family HTH domain